MDVPDRDAAAGAERTRARPGGENPRSELREVPDCRWRASSGCRRAIRWAEGPVYFGDARCLLWSDIPNNRIMRWDEETGATSVYRKPSNYANGNTRDRQGRLVTAEHGRRVTRTEYDGRITVLMDRFEGKRLNSPNDIVVKSDDFDLVHRHERRHHRQLERRGRRAGDAAAGLPHRRQDRAGGDRHRRRGASGRTGLPSRPTRRSSMWSRASRGRARSTCSTWSTADQACQRQGS